MHDSTEPHGSLCALVPRPVAGNNEQPRQARLLISLSFALSLLGEEIVRQGPLLAYEGSPKPTRLSYRL